MCGFAGILSNSTFPEVILKSISDTIAHRGPDHTGFYRDDRASFVHTRLSLLDLSVNGHQPYVDDKHVLVYNGEIYNHQALRKQRLGDVEFLSNSDTETLFQHLKRYGLEETCRRINGMFAFAWYDRESRDLHLVRDRLGIKPLFYMQGSIGFVVSSELKVITRHFETRLDRPVMLTAALGELENTRTKTAFDSVHQLEPGHILHVSGSTGSVSIKRYFGLSEMVDRDYFLELSEMPMGKLTERFEELLKSSIDSMLMSDVGMGAFVSGGIDSSLIATLASRNQPIRMYTSNVVGRHSELSKARLLSDFIGQDLHVSDFHPEDLVKHLVKTTWHYESPIVIHSNAVPFQVVANAAKLNSTKAVLTGEGADELFLGYPRLLSKRWEVVINLPFSLTASIYRRIPGLAKYLNLDKLNPSEEILRMPIGFMNQSMREEYENAFSFVDQKERRADHILTLSMISRSLHSLLWRNDRMGMMHSVESRFPFLDEELFRFAINLPIHAKIGRGFVFNNYKHPFLIDKHILRRVAKKYLPRELSKAVKKGFPMYGIENIRFERGFFKVGFLQETYRLSSKDVRLMEDVTDPKILKKLALVEIWGRLFVWKEEMQGVEERVLKQMCMETPYS